jgi:hypothetical protein
VARAVGVEVGSYCHIADSFHIYGSYFDEFEGFLGMISKRSPEQRVWSSTYALPMFVEGCNTLLAEESMPAEKKVLIQARKEQIEQQIH